MMRRGLVPFWVLVLLFVAAAAVVAFALWRGRGTSDFPVVQGVETQEVDTARVRPVIQGYGCGACHEIPGLVGANGEVGPPLGDVGERAYIAGVLPNTPENMIRWIRNPQEVAPGSAMPDLGVTEADARVIAAYLYSLRWSRRWP